MAEPKTGKENSLEGKRIARGFGVSGPGINISEKYFIFFFAKKKDLKKSALWKPPPRVPGGWPGGVLERSVAGSGLDQIFL